MTIDHDPGPVPETPDPPLEPPLDPAHEALHDRIRFDRLTAADREHLARLVDSVRAVIVVSGELGHAEQTLGGYWAPTVEAYRRTVGQ